MSIEVLIENACYGKRTVLKNIRFSIADGAHTIALGRNGSGKSTLISCICSFLDYRGKIIVDGYHVRELSPNERARHLSAVLQNPTRPHITVEELVALGRSPYHSILSQRDEEDIKQIQCALRDSSLDALRYSYIDSISGGELRRAYFAMMMAQGTRNILLDEATAFMDADYEHRFWEMVSGFCKRERRAVFSVTHHLDNALTYADNIILLNEGEQLFFGSREELLHTDLIEMTFGVKRYVVGEKIFFSVSEN